MDDIISLKNYCDGNFTLERTEQFIRSAEKVSKCIASLNIDRRSSDILTDILVEHVNVAEKEGFKQGYGWALLLSKARRTNHDKM